MTLLGHPAHGHEIHNLANTFKILLCFAYWETNDVRWERVSFGKWLMTIFKQGLSTPEEYRMVLTYEVI